MGDIIRLLCCVRAGNYKWIDEVTKKMLLVYSIQYNHSVSFYLSVEMQQVLNKHENVFAFSIIFQNPMWHS